ncbi:secreted RxLR effector protein 161-like [Impatiens glandulifera]|uniref:secreted RxLR effector protein 161-like n=1 Tax=Impatiens glandulifera TaxID=253017 RepID=UPI001FB14184|nr:secreted RxLR effector protein 161-like [Impatiens glandulifera]
MKYFLGIKVKHCSSGLFICQKRYAQEVLERFGMKESNVVKNSIVLGTKLIKDEGGTKIDETMYKQVVGSFMYLTVTKPDLLYGVSLISGFMANPTTMHWTAAKRMFRYLKGTYELGILYKKGEANYRLVRYTDNDYVGDLNDRRSASGYVFFMGSGAVSWTSKNSQP